MDKDFEKGLRAVFGPSKTEIAVLLFFGALRYIAIGGLIGLGIRFFIK